MALWLYGSMAGSRFAHRGNPGLQDFWQIEVPIAFTFWTGRDPAGTGISSFGRERRAGLDLSKVEPSPKDEAPGSTLLKPVALAAFC